MQVIKKQGRMNVPVEIFSDSVLDSLTKNKLKITASFNYLEKPVIALPDIHYKKADPFPTGIVVASNKIILPLFEAPNCGMSFIRTDLTELSRTKIAGIFKKIRCQIPASSSNVKISKKEIIQILKEGADWALKNLNFIKEEIKNIENTGNLFRDKKITEKEIYNAIPPIAIKSAQKDIGTLGGGNHFIELQTVRKVINKKKAKKYGLKKNQLVIMIHTDSGSLGGLVSSIYSNAINRNIISKLKIFFYQLYFHNFRHLLNKVYLDKNSYLGRRLIIASNAAMNFGYVNRLIIINNLKKIFPSKLTLLADSSHVSLQEENNLLIHRIGAVKATKGKLLMVPGSMGTLSYICESLDNKRTLHSANHGTGRKVYKDKILKTFSEKQVKDFLKNKKISLFRYNIDNIIEQAPQSFRNSKEVIKEMVKYKIAKPIVELQPIAVLKG